MQAGQRLAREGGPAEIKLMGCNEIVRGHVGGAARAIDVPSADPITKASRTSTRYSPGFTSLNACRSASKSIKSLKAFAWLRA